MRRLFTVLQTASRTDHFRPGLATLLFVLATAAAAIAQQGQSPATPLPAVPPPAAPPAAAPNPQLPTLFIVGDSTARYGGTAGRGWGDELAGYFNLAKINVVNRARAGRGTRTFIAQGHWDELIKELKRGDFVLIQFGHNDLGPVDGPRSRAPLPGIGEETRDVPLSGGKTETVQTFGAYLRTMIASTRAKGATPILLSPTVRNIWKNDKIERRAGLFGYWSSQVATAEGAAYVDATTLIADHYEKLGRDKVSPMFGPDYVHTSPAGASLNAALIVSGLQRLKGAPLSTYLSPKGKAVDTMLAASLAN